MEKYVVNGILIEIDKVVVFLIEKEMIFKLEFKVIDINNDKEEIVIDEIVFLVNIIIIFISGVVSILNISCIDEGKEGVFVCEYDGILIGIIFVILMEVKFIFVVVVV